MALDIHQVTVRYWETLVLSMLKAGLLKTGGRSLQLRKYLEDSKRAMI